MPPVTGGHDSVCEDTGTGLGLPISLQLARMIDGEIEVASALGSSSTFTLVVPGEPGDVVGGPC